MQRRLPPSMLVISPGSLTMGARGSGAEQDLALFPGRAREVLRAGASGLLLREPDLEDGPLLELALELRALIDREAPGAWLGLHDRAHLVQAAGADGAHLAGGSLPVAEARRVLGDRVTLGVSTHQGDPEERWSGADYALHAPIFSPHSKDLEGEALGPSGLRAFCADCRIPVWALGGVDAQRLPELDGAGAAGAAAIGAVWGLGHAAADGGLGSRVRTLTDAAARVFTASLEAGR